MRGLRDEYDDESGFLACASNGIIPLLLMRSAGVSISSGCKHRPGGLFRGQFVGTIISAGFFSVLSVLEECDIRTVTVP